MRDVMEPAKMDADFMCKIRQVCICHAQQQVSPLANVQLFKLVELDRNNNFESDTIGFYVSSGFRKKCRILSDLESVISLQKSTNVHSSVNT